MKIETQPYFEYQNRLPQKGKHIVGYQEEDSIVVYQAYQHRIADFAVNNQFFGGSKYSYNRMSWIKPNFLWMMYRCGWAEKEGQERVLAIWIKKHNFEEILEQSVFTSFNPKFYANEAEWEGELNKSNVRLQWDPDHNPFGDKLERKAMQLGLKGETLEKFGKQQIIQIEDITGFVSEQRQFVKNNELEKLSVPIENIFLPSSSEISSKTGVSVNQ